MLKKENDTYQDSRTYAKDRDLNDPLGHFREKFIIPKDPNGDPLIYLCGNSLGLQPKKAREYIEEELTNWGERAVEGHFEAKVPWTEYHEILAKPMADILGAKPSEVVIMNTLTTNLHLMMVSFYQPTQKRHKILIESDAFPSDNYAVKSQIEQRGFDPEESLIFWKPRENEELCRLEDLEQIIEEQGDEIALLMIGNSNYYTGQRYPIKEITEMGHKAGCMVGFDLAHGAGNIVADLHDNGPDFAVWCTYKYLNSGPGSLGGCFVHERHANNRDLPRFTGWWGHKMDSRFNMRVDFDPIPGADGWQLSNPPILSMAPIRASLEIFAEAGFKNIRKKAIALTGYLEFLIENIGDERIHILTPRDPEQRGSQLSIQVKDADRSLFDGFMNAGIICDWREPDVIRVAPAPLYNSFEDVYEMSVRLRELLKGF
ncbi:kynureninase [Flavimarina sp. Hel_I_48]|uniref:kynureninase n=1 Tax=Flavimarina sp. Hel_I_48 TaxID=1392488 RepID=UPI0004DF7075|nr:kynureninase [Flavimarina sp. Hel_I_48]